MHCLCKCNSELIALHKLDLEKEIHGLIRLKQKDNVETEEPHIVFILLNLDNKFLWKPLNRKLVILPG